MSMSKELRDLLDAFMAKHRIDTWTMRKLLSYQGLVIESKDDRPVPSVRGSSKKPQVEETDDRFIRSTELRRILGYSENNRAGFMVAVKKAGIPHIRLNSRVFLFDRAAVEAWLAKKSVNTLTRETADLTPQIARGEGERETQAKEDSQ